ncbi:MAG: hypothetical protein GY798_21865 [Hyphomicrobiales bacterium]|nr:hypothetical protein [Hyphomicrobiales bacterium]
MPDRSDERAGALMQNEVFLDEHALGAFLASQILADIRDANRQFLLGCPGGRSPIPVYQAMSGMLRHQSLDLSRLIIVMMDDYVQQTRDGFEHVDADSHFSCRRFAHQDIVAPLNDGLPSQMWIKPENVWFPDPGAPKAYDTRLADGGGIDFFILASGAGDGHIAFNPPGSRRDSRSRVVELAEQTRMDNMATFPRFESIDQVPRHGVTVGIDTIASLSRRAALVVWGEGKQTAFRRISAAHTYDPDWPASILSECNRPMLLADQAAAGRAQ